MSDDPGTPLERERRLFEAACDLPADEHAAFLDRECRGDERLRARLLALLAADADSAGELDRPAAEALTDRSRAGEGHPERIGAYRIVRVLGRGGMGVVYEAEQESPARPVALKVVRPGFVTESLLRRFEHEARVLAWLNHPGIAQIFDAGTAEVAGELQPFFAMELVRGTPLLEFAREQRLNTGARLELLARVCDAVHHAHQKGVIHRDLKPANVLVDASGQPKVLDFGVARVTDADLQTTTLQTETGELIGTLTYMSPEQVMGHPDAVDTRSDVYALGVIAHELLAHRPPFELRGKLVHEAARVILEDEPSTLGALDPDLRGDVETIVAKALEKDKERRYASAEELASDVRRFLEDEPIVARPASTFYQLRKFARRNRALVTGATLAVVALVAGTVTSTWLYLQADGARAVAQDAEREEARQKQAAQEALERAVAAERDARTQAERAEYEAGVATEVKDFLVMLLSRINPSLSYGKEITLDGLLERGREEALAQDLAPQVRAEVLATIAMTYQGMGRFAESTELLEIAAEAARDIEDPLFQDARLRVLRRLGRSYMDVDRPRDSLTVLAEALEVSEAVFGPEHAATLRVRMNIALAHMILGELDQAEVLLEGVVEVVARRDLENAEGDEGQEVHDFIRTTRSYLAHIKSSKGDHAAALEQVDGVIDFYLRRERPDDPHLVPLLTQRGDVLLELGRPDEARAAMERALEIAELHFESAPYLTPPPMMNLARWYLARDLPDEAEALLERAGELMDASGQQHHRDRVVVDIFLSDAHLEQGRFEQALGDLVAALELCLETLGPGHPRTVSVLDRAEPLLRTSGELRAELTGRWLDALRSRELEQAAAELASVLEGE